MKLGLLAASVVLVAAGATGCGDDGDGGAEDAPSTDEFCSALAGFQDDFSDTDPTQDLEGYIADLKDAADRLEEIGTPEDMPADAREGFDITIETIRGVPDDATLDDLAKMGDVSEADQEKLDALDDYISETCPELDGDSTASPEVE